MNVRTRFFLALILGFGGLAPTALPAAPSDQAILTTVVQGRFVDVVDSLTASIGSHGARIAHVVPAREVLAASEADFGDGRPRFKEAQIIEFCTARLSHALVRQAPEYLVLCPFSISVYELAAQPGRIQLSYRNPEFSVAGPPPVLIAVRQFLASVIEDGTQWFAKVEISPQRHAVAETKQE